MSDRSTAGPSPAAWAPSRVEGLDATLSHEHIIADGTAYLEQPQGDEAQVATHRAVSAETHALAVPHAYLNPANVMLDEPDISTRGAGRFAAIGGSTIVDVTSGASVLRQLTFRNPAAFFAGSEVLQ